MAETQIDWPKRTRKLKNSVVDSTRWDGFKFRDDDIVIASYPKSGTTLMQQIAGQLVLGAPDLLIETGKDSPWPEMPRFVPLQVMMDAAEKITHRRFIKTHLPIDTLVFSPRAKYIYVARDPRDVVWSAYNHLVGFTDFIWQSGYPGRRPQGSERDYYLEFLAGNTAVMPTFDSYWEHVRGWWACRHLPNVLFVHYANLKSDLAAAIRRIARFLDIPVDEALMPRILEHCSIDYMRAKAAADRPADNPAFKADFEFFNKGTIGRWKDVLSAEEIARCDEVAAKHLTPECAHWLKTGELPKDN